MTEPAPLQPASPEPTSPERTPPDTAQSDTAQRPGLTVDAVGLRCPLPIIRLATAARTARPETVITLLSTDPAAEPDVAAWCRMRGQHLLDQTWSAPPPVSTPSPESTSPPESTPPRTLISRIRVTR